MAHFASSRSCSTRRARTDVVGILLAGGEGFANIRRVPHLLSLVCEHAHEEAFGSSVTILPM